MKGPAAATNTATNTSINRLGVAQGLAEDQHRDELCCTPQDLGEAMLLFVVIVDDDDAAGDDEVVIVLNVVFFFVDVIVLCTPAAYGSILALAPGNLCSTDL